MGDEHGLGGALDSCHGISAPRHRALGSLREILPPHAANRDDASKRPTGARGMVDELTPTSRYRRVLRITWTMGCVVVAVALCGLWVRSYWRSDELRSGNRRVVQVSSYAGSCYLYSGPNYFSLNDGWQRVSLRLRFVEDGYYEPVPMVVFAFFLPNSHFVRIPHWLLVTLFGTAAVAPWLRKPSWRYSLRTLLLAMTAIAVALGVVVYLTKAPTTPPLDVGDFDDGTATEMTH